MTIWPLDLSVIVVRTSVGQQSVNVHTTQWGCFLYDLVLVFHLSISNSYVHVLLATSSQNIKHLVQLSAPTLRTC